MFRITLKALANFSPGLRFGNPGQTGSFLEYATLKELPLHSQWANPSQLLQSGEKPVDGILNPGVSKQTLGWN